ncbi:MAG: carbonic anhydrase [Bacteroidetes bacterium 4572_77]|nr:MAG: carbonic anhydrase [Bacteroidetes bacterium 4572_77]
MIDYRRIFVHNRRWARRKRVMQPGFFKRHFSEQKPDFLYIGCSDSRVSIEKLMGVDIGEVFVHRNIANIVDEDDDNIKAVIQYAVDVLGVQHIVVSGHTGCGGIKASLEEGQAGAIDKWLKKIKKVYYKYQSRLEKIDDKAKMLDEYSKLNVLEQCRNIEKLPCVKKKKEETGFPIVHPWMYNMSNGHLCDLHKQKNIL